LGFVELEIQKPNLKAKIISTVGRANTLARRLFLFPLLILGAFGGLPPAGGLPAPPPAGAAVRPTVKNSKHIEIT
jgi:hypothetical protein